MSGFIAVHTGKMLVECMENNYIFLQIEFLCIFNFVGAGNVVNDTPFKKICKDACIRGTDVLKQGGSVLGEVNFNFDQINPFHMMAMFRFRCLRTSNHCAGG